MEPARDSIESGSGVEEEPVEQEVEAAFEGETGGELEAEDSRTSCLTMAQMADLVGCLTASALGPFACSCAISQFLSSVIEVAEKRGREKDQDGSPMA